MQNIWGMLRSLAHVIIVWTRPSPDHVAATDGRHIWIDPALTETERRCFLAHEAIHIKHGHTSCQTHAIERQVCLETALWLIPFSELKRVASWARNPADMAEELGVTEQIVIDRFQLLTGDQIQELWPADDYYA